MGRPRGYSSVASGGARGREGVPELPARGPASNLLLVKWLVQGRQVPIGTAVSQPLPGRHVRAYPGPGVRVPQMSLLLQKPVKYPADTWSLALLEGQAMAPWPADTCGAGAESSDSSIWAAMESQ